MKKYLLNTLLAGMVLAGVGMPVRAAQPGATCGTAIELGDSFRENIEGAKTVWYSAWTFDLPLTVYFAPQNETDPAPEVEMDFTCTSGIYTDSILCSLFCKNGGNSGVDFGLPYKATLQTDHLPDGTFVYYLSLGKRYRDLLLQMGISYNVQVFVKVTYKSAGVISIAPNDLFANCMDGHKFIRLGDTVRVQPQDKKRHVIVPYVQWQEDSVRYVWDGTEPVTVAIGYGCSFDPTDNADETILDFFSLGAKDTLKVTSESLKYYVKFAESEAGMFYAKFYTAGSGIMKIEAVPQAPPQGDATLLRYDRATPVDTAKLYAVPYTWTAATRFDVPTDHIFRMYIGNKYDFIKEEAIAAYQFSRSDDGHWLGLMEDEMKALWKYTQEQYLYVRFECTAKTAITPTLWTPSECISKTILIAKKDTLTIPRSSAQIYRVYYKDWEGGDVTVEWNKSSQCKWLISGLCEISTNEKNDLVRDYILMNTASKYTRSADVLARKWAPYVDEDGFVYMRFYTSVAGGGRIIISTNAPEEEDPAPIVYPAATVAVACEGEPASARQKYTIRVSAEQDITIYDAEPQDTAGKTAIDKWHQTPAETHTLTLPAGIYTLTGAETKIRIEVR